MKAGPQPVLGRTSALVALLFLVKFVAYAWWVTPLWDVADESGHVSYVEDVARGTLPVLGEARMGLEVTRSWINPEASPGLNWIAQHPPLYYAFAAPVLRIGEVAGLDFEQRVRLTRMPAALFGALALLGLALFLARATGRDELGLAGALFLGATPMFTHLSTGVSHDTLVACTAAWAMYWCARWLDSGVFRHLLYAAALVALCTVTKVTALAMAMPLFFAMAWRIWRTRGYGGGLHPVAQIAALWLVMFTPVCLWILRNLLVIGQPFPGSSLIYDREIVEIGFLELMQSFPFWQHTLVNFIGLLGWNGTGNGVLSTIAANGSAGRFFLGCLAFLSLGAVAAPLTRHLLAAVRWSLAGIGLLLLVWIFSQPPVVVLAKWTAWLLLAALLCTVAAHGRAFVSGAGDLADKRWLLAAGALCVLAFAFLFYHHLWSIFAGAMRATHGRYFYPVVPFLFLLLAWPFRGEVASRCLLGGAVGALLVGDWFYLHRAFGFYGLL